MALTLIKETGAGLANANSYANVADGDAYHEGHLYASAWIGAAFSKPSLSMALRISVERPSSENNFGVIQCLSTLAV